MPVASPKKHLANRLVALAKNIEGADFSESLIKSLGDLVNRVEQRVRHRKDIDAYRQVARDKAAKKMKEAEAAEDERIANEEAEAEINADDETTMASIESGVGEDAGEGGESEDNVKDE